MYFLERKDAEKLLHKVLKSTLKKQSDIDLLMDIALNDDLVFL